ncbi:MAG: hypothetical protein WCG31_08650, partial [Deltaproteobacteria bacterium]
EFRLIDGRRLIVDGSHNEEGIRAVAPLLAALTAPTVIVGALGIDRARPLVVAAAKAAGRLVLVRPDNERACSREEIPYSFNRAEIFSILRSYPSNSAITGSPLSIRAAD